MNKYFIDTNYVLRLLLKDTADQYEISYQLFKKAALGEIEIYTSTVTFFEVYWVLKSNYEYDKSRCTHELIKIINMKFFNIENRQVIEKALKLFSDTTLSLEDCFNVFYLKQYPDSQFATFDKKLQKYT